MEFIPTSVAKGRFTIRDSREYREFTLNPSSIQDTKSYGYPDFVIPGISHPVTQAGSGSARMISFPLRLDSDVGYRVQRRLAASEQETDPLGGDPLQSNQGLRHDLTDEINWYRQFLYPEGNARLGSPDSLPSVLLFTFGPMYQGLPCVMTQCNVTISQWSPDLAPMRADLQIQLKEKILFTVSRSSVYSSSQNTVF